MVFMILLFIFLTCLGFADENKEYLLKANEQNAKWISIILKAISGLVAVIALAFGTVLAVVINQLREISKKIRVTQENINRIKSHEDTIFRLTNDINEVKNQIRDAVLTEKKFNEQEIANLVKDITGRSPSVRLVNILKDLIWKEHVDNLDKLKALKDEGLRNELKLDFFKITNRDLDDQKLIDWLYLLKIKEGSKKDLLEATEKAERESQEFQKALKEGKINLFDQWGAIK